jgi:aminoglycoside phosphotransferase (APT) family kinase protein
VSGNAAAALDSELDRQVFAALGRKFPAARIARFDRQARWRPSWDVELRIGHDIQRLIVRAEKGRNYVAPISLKQEADIHHILERHGVPVPHVQGMLEQPLAMLMDVVPGQINLATASSDAARERIRTQYIEALVRVHAIPTAEFAAAGFSVPSSPREIALNLYAPCERIYRRRMGGRPFALMDFIWRWVSRNVPPHRSRAAFITADSGQFMFEADRLTALIDFEVGYVGDPLAEFAGMRLRDSTEPLGDLGGLMDRYEALTGDRLDKFSIEYHTAGFCSVNGFLLWPLAFDPDADDDYVAYLSFSVGTSRWAITAIAAAIGVPLATPASPAAEPLNYPAAARHLVGTVGRLGVHGVRAEYDRSKADSLARYLERANTYGLAVLRDNLADASRLLGRSVETPLDAERALVEFIAAAGPEQDADLVWYFHRWLTRQDFLLRDCGQSSYLTGIDLQRIGERGRRPA